MKKVCMVLDQIHLNKTTTQNSNQLARQLIAYRAREKDFSINTELLKSLVIRYAEAEKKLIELNKLKNKFLGMAAHDLRNPLTSIRGFSEILLNEEVGPVSEDQKEFLQIINTTSEEMLTLVNDLLDVSAIKSGKLDLQPLKGSLKDLLENRIKIMTFNAEKKNIALHSELAEIPDFTFDPNRIAQVFDNLVSNAVKFSPEGSNIYIRTDVRDGRVYVSVQDEGPGISEEDQAKLFGEFQRLSTQPTGGEKSTGLGLSIVKKIIEAHHGTLSVESEVGKGSTFSFELSLEK